MKPRSERFGSSWLLFLAVPLVWFAHFIALYGIASFAGPARYGPLGFNAVAWTLTGLACLVVGAAWYWSWRLKRRSRTQQSPSDMAAWLALLSLVGILFQSLPLVLTPH
jgi:hypothetical protein